MKNGYPAINDYDSVRDTGGDGVKNYFPYQKNKGEEKSGEIVPRHFGGRTVQNNV